MPETEGRSRPVEASGAMFRSYMCSRCGHVINVTWWSEAEKVYPVCPRCGLDQRAAAGERVITRQIKAEASNDAFEAFQAVSRMRGPRAAFDALMEWTAADLAGRIAADLWDAAAGGTEGGPDSARA